MADRTNAAGNLCCCCWQFARCCVALLTFVVSVWEGFQPDPVHAEWDSKSKSRARIWLTCAPALSRQSLAEEQRAVLGSPPFGGGSHFLIRSKIWLFGTYLELAPHLMVKLMLLFLPGCLKAVGCLLLLAITAIAVLHASTGTRSVPVEFRRSLLGHAFHRRLPMALPVLSTPGQR